MSWIYKDEILDTVPQDAKAFVYKITIIGVGTYYGKKSFYKSIKRPPLKGYKRHRRDTVESNWKKYCSSSQRVKEAVEQGYSIKREILRICYSDKEATYYENKILYKEFPNCINDNISGKFFAKEVEEWQSMT